MDVVKSVFDFYIHRTIGSWVALVRITLFLAEFPVVFWLKADYIFLHFFVFYSPSFLFLIIVAFVVNIEVILCQCVYYSPIGHSSECFYFGVALGQLSCYKLMSMVFGLYYGANYYIQHFNIDASCYQGSFIYLGFVLVVVNL